jgi:23S rRNA (pseudouridine1915-N3)-methyltransferase
LKTCLLVIGKTTEKYIKDGIDIYEKRLRHYLAFEMKVIPEIKKASGISIEQQKVLEGKTLLNSISQSDLVVLLDEHGNERCSIDFAFFLQKKMAQGIKSMVFVVGGAYGFSKEMYDRANEKISLSKMTFSHQMVRLIFIEQLYRSMTILKNEPYHH